jgi:hypothetical protein
MDGVEPTATDLRADIDDGIYRAAPLGASPFSTAAW